MRSSGGGYGASYSDGAAGFSIAVETGDGRNGNHIHDSKMSPKRGGPGAPSPLISPGGTRGSSLSLRLRADVASSEPRKAVSPAKHVENYSLPKLEQGWHKALRNGTSSNHSPPRSPAKVLQTAKSSPELAATYERLSGLYEVGMRLGEFPDRGRVLHPSNLCLKCSERAAICVPCTEEMVHDGINTYIKARGKGAAYLFSNAIARAASSTVLRFVIFKIWKNAFLMRRRLIERGTRNAEKRLRAKAVVLRDWRRYIKDSAAEKMERKVQSLEKRVQQLEEQLTRLGAEHKALDMKHKAVLDELREERTVSSSLAAQVARLEAEARTDDRVIMGLSALCEPMLGLVSRLHDTAGMVLDGMIAPLASPQPCLIPLMQPPCVDAFSDVLAWANETSSDECIGIDRCVSGLVVGACLPRVPGPAMDVAELEDGRHFVRSVAALMLNSGVIPIDGEVGCEGSYKIMYENVHVGPSNRNRGSENDELRTGTEQFNDDMAGGSDETEQEHDEQGDYDGRNDFVVPSPRTEEGAQVVSTTAYTAEDFVTFLRAVQQIETARGKTQSAISAPGAPSLGNLFEVGMAHLGRFVGAPHLTELNACFEKPGASAAVYQYAVLRQFSNERERKRGRETAHYNDKCQATRVEIDRMFDPEADAYTHALNISRYRCKWSEVTADPDAAAGWLDDMIRSERQRILQQQQPEGEGAADANGAGLTLSLPGHRGVTLDGGADPSIAGEEPTEGEGSAEVGDDAITGAHRLAFLKNKLSSELIAFIGATAPSTDSGRPAATSAAPGGGAHSDRGGAASDAMEAEQGVSPSPLDVFRDRVDAGVGTAIDRLRSLSMGFRRQRPRAAREERWGVLNEASVHAFVSCKAMQFALM